MAGTLRVSHMVEGAHAAGQGVTGGTSALDLGPANGDGEDGPYVVTGGWDASVRRWRGERREASVGTGAWVYDVRIVESNEEGAPSAVAVAVTGGMFPDELALLRVLRLTDAASGVPLAPPDGQENATGGCVRVLKHHRRGVHGLDTNGSGMLASASKDAVCLWNIADAISQSDEPLAPTWHAPLEDEVAAVCMLPEGDGGVGVALRNMGCVQMYDTTSGASARMLKPRSGQARGADAVRALGPVIAVACDKAVCVFDTRVPEPVSRVPAHDAGGGATAVASAGPLHLVTGGADGGVALWDMRTFRSVSSSPSPAGAGAVSCARALPAPGVGAAAAAVGHVGGGVVVYALA